MWVEIPSIIEYAYGSERYIETDKMQSVEVKLLEFSGLKDTMGRN